MINKIFNNYNNTYLKISLETINSKIIILSNINNRTKIKVKYKMIR